jgi:hypothetical protein
MKKVIYCKFEVSFLFCCHDGGKHLGDENLSVVVQGGRVLAQLLLLRPCHRTNHSNILITYKGMTTLVFVSGSRTVLSDSSSKKANLFFYKKYALQRIRYGTGTF